MRRALTLLALLLLAPISAPAQEPAAARPDHYARRLARECDLLINSAIKRPYGWAWDDAQASAADAPKQLPVRHNLHPVSLEPDTTPAAGLVLLYAAELLNAPKYADAARNVGKGVAATQQGRGNIPAAAFFGPASATTRERPSPLPDRGPTRAGLALLVSLIDADEKHPADAVTRAAPRAARWLLQQQAETGAWPILYPPGAAPRDATRLVRLDTPDTRDSVLAMLLAYEVLGDPIHHRSVERSLAFLSKVRAGADAEVGAGLWRSANTPSGLTVDKMPEFPAGFDALASRYCVQTFFAAWADLGDDQRLATCELASKTLDDLFKRADGQWHRRFDPKGAATDRASATRPSLFGKRADAGQPAMTSDPALDATVRAITAGRRLGREGFRARLAGGLSIKQHLALTLVGLSDTPLSLDFPATRDEVDGYLKQHEEQFRLIESGGTPPELRGKVQQLWALYLRARVEKQFGI